MLISSIYCDSVFKEVRVTPTRMTIPPNKASRVGISPTNIKAKISAIAGVKYKEIVASDTPTLLIVYAKQI